MDDTPPKPRFRWLRITILFLLLIAAFAGYMQFISPQFAGRQQVGGSLDMLDVRIQALDSTVALQQKRIETLEQKQGVAAPTAPGSTPAPAAALPAADENRIAALEKELATLKATPFSGGNTQLYQSIRLLSAFHRLSEKVMAGKPFAAELSAFEDLAGEEETKTPSVSTLSGYAETGIPTFATLLTAFDQAVETLNIADATPPAGAGAWERFVYNLTHLISVRKIDEDQTGSSAEAIIGRAEAHLDREEIEAAMAEIKTLPEASRGNFAAWLDEAQIATDAPALVDQIEEDVMQKAFHTEASTTAAATKGPQQ